MAKNTKVYSDAQESRITARLETVTTYEEQTKALEELLMEFKMPESKKRSIVAKASTMARAGMCKYITKPDYAKKSTTAGIGEKSNIVTAIAESIGVNAEVIETLEKANKTALIKVYEFINSQVVELEHDEQMQFFVDNPELLENSE